MEKLDFVIKFSKALILLSIAVFFVRCSFGSFLPDVNIQGMKDGDEITVEVIEGGNSDTVIIRKNGEDLSVVED